MSGPFFVVIVFYMIGVLLYKSLKKSSIKQIKLLQMV